MQRKSVSTMPFLVAACFLAIVTLIPGVGSAAESQAATSENNQVQVVVVGNIVNGTGALAGEGDQNTAVGANVQVVNGSLNVVDGFGAGAIQGDGNTAIGVNSQAIDGIGNRAIGYGALAGGGNYNTAIGRQTFAINGDGNTAVGSGAYAGGSQSISQDNTAIGYNSQATAGGSVALGAYSIADRPNTVSVGQPGYERQITNVAPGVYDTDAVNMSQLRGLDLKVDRVAATAFAFSALAPLQYDPKEPTQYAAGMGTYNGTGAIAVGVFHHTRPDVMLNAAIGMSNDGWEKAARFGISWRTGGPKKKELVPAISPVPTTTIVDRVKIILEENEKNN